jgi:hypothetical protein
MGKKKIQKRYSFAKRVYFLTAVFIVLVMLSLSFLYHKDFIKDCLFSLFLIAVFFMLERKYNIHQILVPVGLFAMVWNPLSLVFNFWGATFLGIGYDKWVHLIYPLLFTIVISHLIIAISPDNPKWKIIFAAFIVVGMGSILEVNEFLGSQYLNFQGPTIFSQDNAPVDASPDSLVPEDVYNMQARYDTYWDMVFNIIGSFLGATLLLITNPLLAPKTHIRPKQRRPGKKMQI